MLKFIKVNGINGKTFYINVHQIIDFSPRLDNDMHFVEKGTENKKGSVINLRNNQFPLHVVEMPEEIMELIGEARLA